jgi:hypothetical protein
MSSKNVRGSEDMESFWKDYVRKAVAASLKRFQFRVPEATIALLFVPCSQLAPLGKASREAFMLTNILEILSMLRLTNNVLPC